jgi:uncharacterized SAM-binding protein YcdF (DUF218 family)
VLGALLFALKRKKLGKILVCSGVFIFFFFGFDPVTEFLLDGMENKYVGFNSQEHKNLEQVKYVVVLGGRYVPEPSFHPLTTHLGPSTTSRLIEGIRIYREIPNSKLVLSGRGWAEITEAEALEKLALGLGVKTEDIILDKISSNTYEHTVNLSKLLGKEPFVMVTSAIHMRRAMGTFLKAGLNPIPAPTGHILTGKYALFNMKVPFPTGDNLQAIDMVFNEYAGMFLYTMKGQM